MASAMTAARDAETVRSLLRTAARELAAGGPLPMRDDLLRLVDTAFAPPGARPPTVQSCFAGRRDVVTRRFKYYGYRTPKVVLDRLRAAIAIGLLASGWTQECAAYELGYGNPSGFRYWFERVTHCACRDAAGLYPHHQVAMAFVCTATGDTPAKPRRRRAS